MNLKVACWAATEVLTGGGKLSKQYRDSHNNLLKILEETDASCFEAILKPLQDYVQSIYRCNENKVCNIIVNYNYSLKYNNADVTLQMYCAREDDEESISPTLEINGINDKEVENIKKGFIKKYSLNKLDISIFCTCGTTLNFSNGIPVLACFLDYLGIKGGTWKTTGHADVTLFEVVDIDF